MIRSNTIPAWRESKSASRQRSKLKGRRNVEEMVDVERSA